VVIGFFSDEDTDKGLGLLTDDKSKCPSARGALKLSKEVNLSRKQLV
jgi:hypothetical protein